MIGGKAHILVQIHRGDLGEVQIALFIPFDQLLIGPHRAGAGGKTQNTVGLQKDLGGDDVGRGTAHFPVVFRFNNSHFSIPHFHK